MSNRSYDVIVIGGGLSGCGAALAAARNGAKTLLVERINALGGAPCTMGVNPFMPYKTRDPETGEVIPLSRGIFREIEDNLRNAGAMYNNAFNAEWLKIILNRMMLEAGVDLLFNTVVASVQRDGNRVTSVTLCNKSGLVELEANYYIDCTGDADVAALANFPYRLGRPGDQLCQPMTLCFQICNVDHEVFCKEQHNIIPLWQAEHAKGYIKNPMTEIMVFRTPIPGVVQLNATRIVKKNPTDCWEITEADIIAREQIVELYDFLRNHVPGFENSKIVASAPQTGVRESRMIDGEHILSAEELKDCIKFEDRIAAGNYDIDIHNPEGSGTSHYFFPQGQYYTIPYRSLIPKDAENLLVAGRCISTTHEAQASIRILPIVCTLGEAAGTAAAIANKSGCTVKDVDVATLQDTLTKAGAFIG